MDDQTYLPGTQQHPADSVPAYVIYGCYLVATLTALPMLLGVIIAYIYRDGAAPVLLTHYRYQIRTFWIMWVYLGLCLFLFFPLLPFIVFGLPLFAIVSIWVFIRCIAGMKALYEGMPVPRPASWLF